MAEGPPTRDFIGPYSGCGLHSSPGALKEKARLRAFERELSDLRATMHEVIDTVEREIAGRQVAGTAG